MKCSPKFLEANQSEKGGGFINELNNPSDEYESVIPVKTTNMQTI